uniref:Retinol dehydrogenase 5-like n=1 Tax=Petromyzon marinus TaxID=7757 RepID=A0AAJ7TPX8_PETMA|nr:retinol dehydrogenase 5-like [Petromyzon marinus]
MSSDNAAGPPCCLCGPTCPLVLVAVLGVWAAWYWRDKRRVAGATGRWVLITGCDSGFGRALARRLDAVGLRVVAACLGPAGEEELRRSCSSRLVTLRLDVTDPESVHAAARRVRQEVGEQGLWGLVNNAGRSIPIGPNDWMTTDDYRRVLDVNLLGMVDVTLQMLPLVKQARGRVVNVASILGRVSIVGGGYCISKFGVEAFSDTLRRDMRAFGVKVSIVEPGFFRTAVTDNSLLEEDLRKRWAQLPSVMKEDYGSDYLDKYMWLQKSILARLCDGDLSKVTWCMEHALVATHPRTRYGAGWDAKIVWLPISYLPTFMTDFLLAMILPRLAVATKVRP